ncbi:carbohydrate ABC transporter permease [Aquipuribacter hungaricus]|uniref:Carbohydrate ABC transporter permease n=1 Tax=Aquipuribacter hungaricus TaxID=545624 RepID=A0ABV7WB73_9MICO
MPVSTPVVPGTASPVPGAPPGRRRPARSARSGGPALPYLLLLPATVVLGAMLAWPLVRLVLLSVREFGLAQQFGQPAAFVGLDNYARILDDPQFWAVLGRTVAFCGVTVALTMVLGTLVALLMDALGRGLRLLVGIGLMLAWAMPPVSATIVWQWVFDTRYGLVNYLLTASGAGDFRGHSWLADPVSFVAVAALVVVWMGVPFVAFTLYAGLTQVPREVLEAAQIDGAGPWRRFRSVTVPYLRPLLAILTALSVLWNFRVFTPVYVLQAAGGSARDTNLVGVFAYRISIGENRFDVGAAVAVVMVVLTLALTAVYLRQMARQEDV